MTDQRSPGVSTDVKGKVEETAGKLTGNEEQELHGKAKQVQGAAQKVVDGVQDAAQKTVENAQDALEGLKR